jgi:hypothetical protein
MIKNDDLPPILRTGTATPEANLLLAVFDKAVRDAQYRFEGNYPFTASTAHTERLAEAQAGLEMEIAADGEEFVREVNRLSRYESSLTEDQMARYVLKVIAGRINDRRG